LKVTACKNFPHHLSLNDVALSVPNLHLLPSDLVNRVVFAMQSRGEIPSWGLGAGSPPVGYRGEASVGGLGNDVPQKKLKHL